MELELQQWGDGSIRLYYEAYRDGEDRVFVLSADGTAAEATYGDGDKEVLTPIDLVSTLREMYTAEGR